MIIDNKCEQTPHYVTWSEVDIEGDLQKYFTSKEEAILFYEQNGNNPSKDYKLYLDNKQIIMPNINMDECEMIIDKGSKTWTISTVEDESILTNKLNFNK